ncbi:MAG TPA: flagellar hook-length control protein FliK, partial [Terricaulis sp.]|nr:flagellar hook-length control protein FliK [Terricaulis sp.]
NAQPQAGRASGAQAKAAPTPASAPDFSAFALADTPESAPQTQSAASPAALATQSAAHAQHASAAEHAAARAAPAAAQVSREIIRRFDGGNSRFELRLDPPELGRVEVKLEVSRDHRVNAVISADNPQALNDLMRHARELEQSLQAAGLDLGDNGLSFDLRQGEEGAADAERSDARGGGLGDDDTQETVSAPQTARLERWRGMRIDVMA